VKLEEYKASQRFKIQGKARGSLQNTMQAKVRLTVIKAKGWRVYCKKNIRFAVGNRNTACTSK